MAKYLVVGGCGFIGAHLTERLLQDGHEVRVLDDLSTGMREALAPRGELIVGSASDSDLVRQAFMGVDGCFHLAGRQANERTLERWAGAQLDNLGALITVLDAARHDEQAPTPVVFASSDAVYGDNASTPFAETATPRPITAAGATALAGELHARVASLAHRVPTTGFRFFTVYGAARVPGQPPSSMVGRFAGNIERGEPVRLRGDGSQLRDFLYIDDAVRFLMAGMARRPSGPEIFNACTGRGTSLAEVARALMAVIGRNVPIEGGQRRLADIGISIGDPTLAKARLNVTAGVPLGDGLRRMIAGRQAVDAAA
jgi:UDP-glucose 4-epimerase